MIVVTLLSCSLIHRIDAQIIHNSLAIYFMRSVSYVFQISKEFLDNRVPDFPQLVRTSQEWHSTDGAHAYLLQPKALQSAFPALQCGVVE